ncbi:hypothetical protein [Pseudonocardia alni]|uniref:hypothetical protein n=1 Tax=Pseudonocardia alni TaxID=33907 RepID=UPI00280B171C|nr:hypothetical protein [Pseudonocardia alni]
MTTTWLFIITGSLVLLGLATLVGFLDDYSAKRAWRSIAAVRHDLWQDRQAYREWHDRLSAWEDDLRERELRLPPGPGDPHPPVSDPWSPPTRPEIETEDDREARTSPFRCEAEDTDGIELPDRDGPDPDEERSA